MTIKINSTKPFIALPKNPRKPVFNTNISHSLQLVHFSVRYIFLMICCLKLSVVVVSALYSRGLIILYFVSK